MDEIVYFELNNWTPEKDYPYEEPFITWMRYPIFFFLDEEWTKSNKLVVDVHDIDMSVNFLISAPKSWVENNCPSLLTKYTKFLRYKNEYGDVEGTYDFFTEYYDENIGIHLWGDD